MPTRIISRREGGLVAEPPTSRTKVVRPTAWLLTHYTRGGGSVTDGKSDAQHMAELAAYARNAGKEWEYNYVITAPLGWIWEMAGVYRAAHCQGFNEQSLAVQMNLGVGAAPNAAMVESHRWLRQHLRGTGQWTGEQNVPHYRFRATACCGPQMAGPAGASWNSPTGEGSLGDLLAFMTAPLQEDFVTPEDKTYLETTFADIVTKKVWDRVIPALGELGAGAAHAVLQEARLGNRAYPAISKAITVDGDKTRAALGSVDIEKVKTAVTEAVAAALETATIQADLTEEDVQAIAAASAAATVAEIAS
jgi:hypothetical protein